jgi:hypothetical protein
MALESRKTRCCWKTVSVAGESGTKCSGRRYRPRLLAPGVMTSHSTFDLGRVAAEVLRQPQRSPSLPTSRGTVIEGSLGGVRLMIVRILWALRIVPFQSANCCLLVVAIALFSLQRTSPDSTDLHVVLVQNRRRVAAGAEFHHLESVVYGSFAGASTQVVVRRYQTHPQPLFSNPTPRCASLGILRGLMQNPGTWIGSNPSGPAQSKGSMSSKAVVGSLAFPAWRSPEAAS